MRLFLLTIVALSTGAAAAFASSFRVPNSDCLRVECHSSGAVRTSLNVDAQFDGIGRVTDGAADLLRSQHNIAYTDDNDLGTIETEAVNECKKCHGTGVFHRYVRTGHWLAYPSAIGARLAGETIPRPAGPDFSQYQEFCLSCHRGKVFAATPAIETFNGPLPAAPQQVGPSSRSDPAARQAAIPWRVAAVPAKNVNLASPFTNVDAAPAYFSYYEANGHGRATGLTGSPMDVTCLAGGTAQGCHSPHGTNSRFLLADTFSPVVTAAQISESVCVGCHVPGVSMMGFHSLAYHYRPNPGSSLALGYMAPMANVNVVNSGTNQSISVGRAGTQLTTILPFYSDTNTTIADGNGAAIENRVYGSGTTVPVLAVPSAPGPPQSRDWLHCLSCHDPHGTSTLYQATVDYGETGNRTPNTRGMLRKFPTIWLAGAVGSYANDALCGECHIP